MVCLAVTLVAACASDGRSTSTGVPESTSSIETTSSVATTTSPTTLAPTTTMSSDPHFEPSCHDQSTERDPEGPGDDPALESLGVVGDHPVLEVQLPTAISGTEMPAEDPIAGAVRIPRGLLVTVGAPSSGWFPGGAVAAVDLDGAVRWVRCLNDGLTAALVAPLDQQPDRMLMGTSKFADDATTYSWQVMSLTNGDTLGSLDDLVAESGLTDAAASNRQLILSERGVVVFAPPPDHVVDVSTDGLLRLDLATWALSTTTFPPEFDGHQAGELELGLGTDGSLLRMGRLLDSQLRVPQSVEVAGEWRTDERLRRSVWGPVVDAWYGPDGVLLASWDATGTVRWSSEVRFPGREGFMYARSGDVVVSVSCGPSDGNVACPDERLVGLDADTGRELWALPGWRIVGPMADGIAYVTDSADLMANERPSAWFVLDTETGRLADAPSWPGVDAFRSGCCGEYDYLHTDALGGILVAVSGRTMRVWFPAALTPAATTTVTIF